MLEHAKPCQVAFPPCHPLREDPDVVPRTVQTSENRLQHQKLKTHAGCDASKIQVTTGKGTALDYSMFVQVQFFCHASFIMSQPRWKKTLDQSPNTAGRQHIFSSYQASNLSLCSDLAECNPGLVASVRL